MADLARQLIEKGGAFVCHCTREQVRASREAAREARQAGIDPPPEVNSPWRETSPEENRRKFDAMVAGEYQDGEAVLR
ncbi:hypothetical protein T484DRAFT_1777621 [Baffinella frigidus]|nr:hypothetical protein T484DRAFT_1777621 [Cryptophyta sp. CCMP2293]